MESETEESFFEKITLEESDAVNVKESDNDEPPKNANAKCYPTQEQIKWIKKGINWTTPNDFVDHNRKLRLNIPEGTLTRFSNLIEFFELFFIEDFLGTNF